MGNHAFVTICHIVKGTEIGLSEPLVLSCRVLVGSKGPPFFGVKKERIA